MYTHVHMHTFSPRHVYPDTQELQHQVKKYSQTENERNESELGDAYHLKRDVGNREWTQ